MKRIALALVATAAVLVSGVPAASATTGGGSATGSTSQGSYEISSARIDIDGSGLCFKAPMPIIITVADSNVEWQVEFTVAPPGVVPAAFGFASGNGSTSQTISYNYCPNEYRPTNVVKGKVTFSTYGETEVSTSSDFTFTVTMARAPSQTTITKLTRGSAGEVLINGRVTTTSREYGRVGVMVGSLQVVMKSGKKWIQVGEGVTINAAGDYTAYTTRVVPKNAIFRVDYIGGPANLPSKSKERRG